MKYFGTEAVARRCSVKKENTCARVSFLITLQASGLRPATLLKKRLWHRCSPINFAKFLRAPFLQNTSGVCFCWYNVLQRAGSEFFANDNFPGTILDFCFKMFNQKGISTYADPYQQNLQL